MKKTAIITGGTKGIGRACVEKFLTEGCQVITCSRNQKDLEALQKEFSEFDLHIFRADISQLKDVKAFAAFVFTITSEPLILINNTGIFIQGNLVQEPEGVLEQLMATNVYSAYHLTRALVPSMMEKKAGTIINICSTASITPYVNGGSYCMTKYALLGMTKVFREELKPYHIRVTAVLPGATFTASWEGVDLPQERFMPASDIATCIWDIYQLHPSTVVEEVILRPMEGDIS
ncbi:MAG: SDR family oxidoreductase [Cytophagaceae bacterium]|jgi:short-subunit dehydrogenase|nr:SDR family oxidoreductase [Cytophagaceae bacterium]